MDKENKIIVFEDKKIRRVWNSEKWFFSVVDIVRVLTDSEDPRKYWNKLIQRLRDEGSEVVTFCHQLKLIAEDGKLRETDCADTEGIFRIIQSIPSRKAEPFKRWLAKVGYERVQEIENPELAQERIKSLYEMKGYPDEWIKKRLRGIAVRQELTDEWKKRGVEENIEYAILTNEIAKATFGVSIKDHKKIKNLNPVNQNENLRDYMTDLELIFSMLGEASTSEIVKNRDSIGFEENKQAAKDGGTIAGNAREELEKQSGKFVVNSNTPIIQVRKIKEVNKKKIKTVVK